MARTREGYAALQEAALDKMVTEGRAVKIARILFPEEFVAPGFDCGQAEDGVTPCRFCAEKHVLWAARVAVVRLAVKEGFR